jgi:hypothetical protein
MERRRVWVVELRRSSGKRVWYPVGVFFKRYDAEAWRKNQWTRASFGSRTVAYSPKSN